MQLRFASFVVINSRRDLHPQECARAGRTKQNATRIGVAFRFGGGGGNRTRVRKPSTGSTTCLAWLFDLTRHPPTGRLMQGDPLDFRDRPRGEDDP